MLRYSKFLNSIIIICVIGLWSSCSEPENYPYNPIDLTPDSRAAADNLGDFYLNFTKNMADYVDSNNEIESKNFVVSPLSVSFVLSMMGNAVEGELKNEIIKYLGMDDFKGMNELAYTLLTTLPTIDRKTSMTLANSVWVNDAYKLNADFSGLIENSYLAPIYYFNHKDPNGTVGDINRWCSSHTLGIIKDFINETDFDPNLMVIMLNAMYFKSEWSTPELFNESKTVSKPFKGLYGENNVMMMRSNEKGTRCYIDEETAYFQLPFGNGAFRLEILLPEDNRMICDSQYDLVKKMEGIRDSTEYFEKVTIELPKFKLDGIFNLKEMLQMSGISHLGETTSLSLFNEEVSGCIDFNQNTSFEVDEKGAEAAAVSSAKGGDTDNYDPSEPIEIHVDHPFMFFITEHGTGACLISGRITDL